jgi:hypothetical protein
MRVQICAYPRAVRKVSPFVEVSLLASKVLAWPLKGLRCLLLLLLLHGNLLQLPQEEVLLVLICELVMWICACVLLLCLLFTLCDVGIYGISKIFT